jgi:SAM-dependent MidA family methyltransferase
VGRAGDFSTSATLSPLLARGIAAWLKAALASHGGVRHLIEIGAGSGQLLRDVHRHLGLWTRLRYRPRWHIVETSPALQQRQQETLRGLPVTWHADLPAALQAAQGRAHLYHNELLDAFPCHLYEWSGSEWREIAVRFDPQGRATEERLPAALPPWTAAAAPNVWNPVPGQRIEVHTSVRDWLAGWTPLWQSGQMLTLDYGDVFPALYHRRPGGTLRGYLLHQRVDGPALYQNVGRQDLTADINFTDYRAWTAALGLSETFFDTQVAFLRAQAPAAVSQPATAADAHLLDPEGAGSAFKAVVHDRAEPPSRWPQ